MNGKTIRSKLVGSDDERAVSPVIGVILMVAITVILAAVIAAFVLDLGGSVSEEAQAGVNIDVDETDDGNITVEVTSMGNADYVELGGAASDAASGTTGVEGDDPEEMGVGDVVTFNFKDGSGVTDFPDDSGTITAIAVIEEDNTRTQVASEDYDFS